MPDKYFDKVVGVFIFCEGGSFGIITEFEEMAGAGESLVIPRRVATMIYYGSFKEREGRDDF